MDDVRIKLNERYTALHKEGKKPFAGWTDDEVRVKISEMEGSGIKPATSAAGNNVAKEGAEPGAKEKTYTLTESQLKEIINGNQKQERRNIFERDNEPVPEAPVQRRIYTCRIAVWQKDSDSPLGVVTDLKTIRRDMDPETKKHNVDILRATITYDDGKTEQFEYAIGKHYEIFTMSEIVEIVEEKRDKMKQDKGAIYKTKSKMEGGILTRFEGERTNEQVPLRERFLVPTYVVRRRDGHEYTLPAKVINI